MAAAILRLLDAAATYYGFDFVLVEKDYETYCHAQIKASLSSSIYITAQMSRKKLNASFDELSPELHQKAKRLAKLATNGQLAIFLGAGTSMAAGLPSWGGLLTKLSVQANITGEEKKWLLQLTFLDQARILEKRLGGAGKLAEAVALLLDGDFYCITHSFLAALPVTNYISTNYDTLFERAMDDQRKNHVVIPYEIPPHHTPSASRMTWLLKMHGCVNHPEDIVLTREDYIRYNEQRSALAGIVATTLMTKHLMFVGFSLNDENFFSIASTVRKAKERAINARQEEEKQRRLQQVRRNLSVKGNLFENPLLRELWGDDIDILHVTPAVMKPQGADYARAGRILEIFLDKIVLESCSSHRYFLDPSYEEILTPAEAELKKQMEEFLEGLPADVTQSSAFGKVECMLEELGWSKSKWLRTKLDEQRGKHPTGVRTPKEAEILGTEGACVLNPS